MLAQKQNTTILDGKVRERVYIYCRVSTDEQAEYGTSLETQEEESLAYCRDNNLEVVDIFREDYTGKVLERPELTKVRAGLRAGLADGIVVYKDDRLDRSEWGVNLLLLMQEFRSLGVSFHYSLIKKRVDLNNPMEVLMYGSFGGWKAGEDHRATIEKLCNGKRELAKNGYVVATGNPPYGYEKVYNPNDKKWYFEINEKEAAVIRLIFNWFVFGDESGRPLTSREIAQKLTDMKIPTRSQLGIGNVKTKRKNPRWYGASIGKILHRETYAGVWRFGKRNRRTNTNNPESHIIKVEVPAIISRELWDMAQKRNEINKQKSNRAKREYLLSGKCRCGYCDEKAHPVFNGKQGYYACESLRDSEKGYKCANRFYNSTKLEARVWGWVYDFIQDDNKLRDGFEGYAITKAAEIKPIQNNLKLIDAELNDLEAQWQQLTQSFKLTPAGSRLQASLAIDIDLIENQIKGLEAKRDEYQKELEQEVVTEEQFKVLLDFVHMMRADIDKISKDFNSRCLLLDRLNIKVKLFLDDNRKRMLTITGMLIPNEEKMYLDELTSRNQLSYHHSIKFGDTMYL